MADIVFDAFLSILGIVCGQFWDVILFVTALAVLYIMPLLLRRIIDV